MGISNYYWESERVNEMERKSADIRIRSVWVGVCFDCPHCEAEVEIDYDDFVKEQGSDFLEDWCLVTCPECGEEISIAQREVD